MAWRDGKTKGRARRWSKNRRKSRSGSMVMDAIDDSVSSDISESEGIERTSSIDGSEQRRGSSSYIELRTGESTPGSESSDLHQPLMTDDSPSESEENSCTPCTKLFSVCVMCKQHGMRWCFKELRSWHERDRSRTYFFLFQMFATVLCVCLSFFNLTLASTDAGKPLRLSCFSNIWKGPRMCGLDGLQCGPFSADKWQPIRCPYTCHWPDRRQPVVGSGVYRADSYICKAAIHSGKIPARGGCSLFRRTGQRRSFKSSTANGVTSFASKFWFPASFEFKTVNSEMCTGGTSQYVLLGLFVSVLAATRAFWGHASFAYLFSQSCVFGMLLLGLVVDPKSGPAGFTIQRCFQNMVILAPLLFLMYMMNVNYAFNKLVGTRKEPGIEEEERSKCAKEGWCRYVFLFLTPLFAALHMHYLSHVLPDLDLTSRLFSHGLHQTKTLVCVLSILAIVLALVVYHVRGHYRQGTLQFTLCLYAALGAVLAICSTILGGNYSVHLHHSFTGFVLFLGTRIKNSHVSLFSASLCLGMVINGIMLWGWDGNLFDFTPGGKYPKIDDNSGNTGGSSGGPGSGGSGVPHDSLNLMNSSLSNTSVTVSWNGNVTGPNNIILYRNNIMVLQQGIYHPAGPSHTFNDMLPETNYFFQLEYVSFDTFKTFFLTSKLFVRTMA